MAGIEFVKVIDVGPGWNKVLASDGNVYTLRGNYNWRSNNPGNLEYGPFARSMGAIGEGAPPPGRSKGFAIFPTFEMGQQARYNLQFEQPRYANLTIAQAIEQYAPRVENDTDGYINIVSSAAGVPSSTLMKDLTPEQRQRFLQAQMQHEGFVPGKIMGEAGTTVPQNVIRQFSATPLPPSEIGDDQNGGYVVRRGDTLGRIAERLGTTVEELAAANGISDPNRIRAGQTLNVPGRPDGDGLGTMPSYDDLRRFRQEGVIPVPTTQSDELLETRTPEMPPLPRPRPDNTPGGATTGLTPLPTPEPLRNPMASPQTATGGGLASGAGTALERARERLQRARELKTAATEPKFTADPTTGAISIPLNTTPKAPVPGLTQLRPGQATTATVPDETIRPKRPGLQLEPYTGTDGETYYRLPDPKAGIQTVAALGPDYTTYATPDVDATTAGQRIGEGGGRIIGGKGQDAIKNGRVGDDRLSPYTYDENGNIVIDLGKNTLAGSVPLPAGVKPDIAEIDPTAQDIIDANKKRLEPKTWDAGFGDYLRSPKPFTVTIIDPNAPTPMPYKTDVQRRSLMRTAPVPATMSDQIREKRLPRTTWIDDVQAGLPILQQQIADATPRMGPLKQFFLRRMAESNTKTLDRLATKAEQKFGRLIDEHKGLVKFLGQFPGVDNAIRIVRGNSLATVPVQGGNAEILQAQQDWLNQSPRDRNESSPPLSTYGYDAHTGTVHY